jgi:UDP-N-acetylglucosamine--N-acetylmuramyl-(pentapeptide) pyrophosphoryl-undecaprenol N-acetylglucosamine transferase
VSVAGRPVIIAAGGTGGHVIPALEVVRVLSERGVPVVWMGTRNGIEARLVPAANIAIEWIDIGALRGKGPVSAILALFNLLRACLQAWQIMRRWQPCAVLGMGGFVAAPGGLIAWLTRRPLVLHEQNAVPGMTNKILRPLAKRVLQAMAGTFSGSAQTVGNPVRKEMTEQATPQRRFAGRNAALRLLVFGGSQGARVLNETVPAAIRQLDCEVAVHHQSGAGNRAMTEKNYAGVERTAIQVDEFIEDMAGSFAWADLVVCRSGAMTVAELAAVGVASILVPYPYAVDDHQTANGRQLVSAGAAILRRQQEFCAEWLAVQLAALNKDRARLLEMATSAHRLAQPDSAIRVADAVLEVAR